MAAPPLQPAASPSPPRPPPPLSLPPPPLPHHDTTLTLALALPPPPLACAISPRPLQARRLRPDGGGAASPAFARVRSSPTGDTPPCSECGKRFPSWKALFGHMRCHPERQWRGITPPPHFRLHQAVGAPAGSLAAAAAAEQFTVQEREIATSLLMLAGARPGAAAKGRKSNLAPPSAAKKESCGGATASSPAAAPPPPSKCDDHKCSVCARGFATGQALGGHKRCHWERACAEGMMAVATPTSSCGSAVATSQAAPAAATTLDLNLPPPGTMILPRKSDEDAALDLKLGY